MRQPLLVRNRPGLPKGQKKSTPAPVKGWNTRDSDADMDPLSAKLLDNFFPKTNEVASRAGSSDWATGMTGTVRTVFSYASTTKNELFACTEVGIYDVTLGGAVGAAKLAVTNGIFSYDNFATNAGSFLVAVNGTDKLVEYDGTTWKFIAGASTPAITGVATTSLVYVKAHQRRLWFLVENSMSAWYLPTGSIAGALTEFPLGPLFTRGGKLMTVDTWSIDGGDGPKDYLCFFSSEGEVAVYSGTDPASSATWGLVGTYYIGEPVSRRCTVKYGADLLVFTKEGLYPLSKALPTATIQRTSAISDNIASVFSAASNYYTGKTEWQLVIFAADNMLIANIPVAADSRYDQYVMNTITKAWCRFRNWKAYCFAVWKSRIFYGTNGKVVEALVGGADNGQEIECTAIQAYNYFNTPNAKLFHLMRPLLKTDGPVKIQTDLLTDFQTLFKTGYMTSYGASGAAWDSGIWDASTWSDDYTIRMKWKAVVTTNASPVGAVALRVRVKNSNLSWTSTEVIFESGSMF